MGGVLPFEDPTNYKVIKRRILRLWDEGYVEIPGHAQEWITKQDLDSNDLQHVFRYGRVTEHSRPKDLWRYKIEGTSVDGTKMACVVEIDGNLIIVTVIVPSKRTR